MVKSCEIDLVSIIVTELGNSPKLSFKKSRIHSVKTSCLSKIPIIGGRFFP